MKILNELTLPSIPDLTRLGRNTSLALSLAVLTLGGGIKTTGADSTWNSPTDFVDTVWEYDADNDVWWELKPDGTRRDDGILKQTHWNGTAPFWDDDDFIIAYHGQICVFDHDLRLKHYALAGGAFVSNVALTPDGLLRSVTLLGGMNDWTKDGPFRYTIVPTLAWWQEDIKVANDGLTYAVSYTGHIMKVQLGDDFDWPHSDEFRYGNFASAAVAEVESTLSSLAIVPDDTHGYTLWTCGVAWPSYITFLRPDLTQITDEWVFDFDETDFSTFFYDKNSHTVLGGRYSGDGMVAVEYDAKKHTKVREFRLSPEDHYLGGITRGPNDTVVAIDRTWSKIYQWEADGTFLRAVHLPTTSSFREEENDIGGIVWAGTVASSSPAPNTQPSISCAQIAPVDCAPNSGIFRNIIADVTDPDSQDLTVTLKMGASVIAQQTVEGPANNREVNFAVEAFPGLHTLTVEVSDGQASASCSTEIAITADVTAPTVSAVPAEIQVEATSPEGAIVNFDIPTAADLCSGVVPVNSSHQPGTTFPVGETTVRFSATDANGNTAHAETIIKVVAAPAQITWSGVLQPINSDGTSVFKAGRVIPVKFELTGASAGITDLVARLNFVRFRSDVPGRVNEADAPGKAMAGNQFVYDPQTGCYVFNWSTKGLPPGTYQLQIDLGDDILRTATLALR